MRLALVALVFALVACADDHYRMVKSPDGAHFWYAIPCSGHAADCRDEARLVCRSAYSLAPGHPSSDTEMMVQCQREPVPPGPSRYAVRVCMKDPLMRSNMEEAVVCPP